MFLKVLAQNLLFHSFQLPMLILSMFALIEMRSSNVDAHRRRKTNFDCVNIVGIEVITTLGI